MTYIITATHDFSNAAGRQTDVTGWDNSARGGFGAPAIYDTRAEALTALSELNATVYYLRHNETGRPVYKIRTVASLPAYLQLQL